MSKILKLTLATGQVHEIPLEQTSTITVRTRETTDPSVTIERDWAYTSVVAAEVVDPPGQTGDPTAVVEDTLSSPGAALDWAQNLPVADAAAHVEKALALYPGDTGLLAKLSQLDAAIRGVGQPPADAGETSTPPVPVETAATALEAIHGLATPDEALAAVTVALEKWPTDEGLLTVKVQAEQVIAAGAANEALAAPPVEPDPATLETPTVAIDHAKTLPLDDAVAHVDAALVKFPDDPDLLAVKDEIAQIRAQDAGTGGAPADGAGATH